MRWSCCRRKWFRRGPRTCDFNFQRSKVMVSSKILKFISHWIFQFLGLNCLLMYKQLLLIIHCFFSILNSNAHSNAKIHFILISASFSNLMPTTEIHLFLLTMTWPKSFKSNFTLLHWKSTVLAWLWCSFQYYCIILKLTKLFNFVMCDPGVIKQAALLIIHIAFF